MANLPILRITLTDFSNIKPPLHSFHKPHIIMADYLSNICRIGFAGVLLRIFDPAFLGKIYVGFHFLSCRYSWGAGAILTSSGSFRPERGYLLRQGTLWWRPPGCTSSGPPRPGALDATQANAMNHLVSAWPFIG